MVAVGVPLVLLPVPAVRRIPPDSVFVTRCYHPPPSMHRVFGNAESQLHIRLRHDKIVQSNKAELF
jgi:hypothetical protein